VRTRTGRGVGLPETKRIFFTKENYPQRVDTDDKKEKFALKI